MCFAFLMVLEDPLQVSKKDDTPIFFPADFKLENVL